MGRTEPLPDVYVRADANSRIGWGHVIRTGVLAEGLREVGCSVTWLVRDSDAAALRHLRRGFRVRRLKRDLVEASAGLPPGSWLLVDRYGWGAPEQKALRRRALRLAWIDDLGGGEFAADLVVNQNFGAQRLRYRGARGTRFLLGTSYVLLRPAFRRRPPSPRPPRANARRVLVTFGGSDPRRLTEKVIRSLRGEGLQVRAVVGPSARAPRGIPRAGVFRNVPATGMRRLMEWADVAVAAPGSTVWELAYLGVPAVLIGVADNQTAIGERLKREGRAVYLGWHDDVTDARIAAAVRELLRDRAGRARLRRRGREMVDGKGLDRILGAMGL